MLKKSKSAGIICIILAITVLALAALVGAIWILSPEIEEDDGYYMGGLNFGSPDPVLYRLTSDETLGTVYLKSQSYGNFDGKKWDESIPEYDELINSKYSASYLTSLALENNSAKNYLLTIEPTTNKYVLPYYVSTSSHGGYSNVQTSDIKNEGTANATYSVYLHKYTSSSSVSHTQKVANYESEYSKFVKENYLTLDDEMRAFMENIIRENNLDPTDSDIISKVTTYIRSVARYDLLYDTGLDKEENTVISFMSGEYSSGVCRHFASSATLLYRALGIPARYTVGYLTKVVENEVAMVTALNAHAWVEVYIDGIGWIQVEPTPPYSLESPPDDPEPPVQSVGLFKVQSAVKTTTLLKTKSYTDYLGNSWSEGEEYISTISGSYGANYMTSMAIEQSGYAYMNSLEITPMSDVYALPYYISTQGRDSHIVQSSDRVISGNESESFTVYYYNYPDVRLSGSSKDFKNFSKNYESFVNNNYLNASDSSGYIRNLIKEQGWEAKSPSIEALVCNYLKDNYKLSNKYYDEELDYSDDYVVDFLTQYTKGSSKHFAAAATLIFRYLGIPARLTTGYKVNIPAKNVSVVTSDNTHYWVEIYKNNCGWVAIDIFDKYEVQQDENEVVEVFQIYSDKDEDHLYLKEESFGDYNGQGFDKMLNTYNQYYNGYSAAHMTGAIIEMGSYSTGHIQVQMLMSNYDIPYMLPYYMPSYNYGAQMQMSDVAIEGPSNSSYSAQYYTYNVIQSLESNYELRKYEEEYKRFVEENYLNIDAETMEYLYYNVILPRGWNSQNPDIIYDVASFIQNEAEYNLEYDQRLDNESNVVIAFLDRYNKGICQHYAMAATMLYRALGIPARYTTGFVTETKAGEWVTVTNMQAHAWVEVYVDGFGWMQVEVTGGYGTSNKTVVEITVDSIEHQYDGKEWNPGVTFTGFEAYEKLGYNLYVQTNTPNPDPGRSKIKLVDYIVFDPNGKDVTSEFSIKLSEDSGEYYIYIDTLHIYSDDISFVYNGMPHSGSEGIYTVGGTDYRYYVFDNEYAHNTGEYHNISITPTTQLTNVGNVSNKFNVAIMNGTTNVTGLYKIVKHYGVISVTERSITISAASKTVDYLDYLGAKFEYNEIIYDRYELADGDYIGTYDVSGEISEPGRVDNVLDPKSIRIYNKNGEDVTANYHITTYNGVLEMIL